MDVSEIYIKMCDCPEIQGQWKPNRNKLNVFLVKKGYYSNGAEPGNGEYWVDQGDIAYCGENDRSWRLEEELKNYTWLPSQDQIQEMLDCKDIQIALHRLYQITEFWWIDKDLKSLEQLWLAFYMMEKHQKIWTGQKWERAN